MSENMEKSLLEILSSISSDIKVVSSVLHDMAEKLSLIEIRLDSNQSNQIRSDQIRSDQISNNNSNAVNYENWMAEFVEHLHRYSIPYEGIDLYSIESGAMYYLRNQSKIMNRIGYLKKIMKSAKNSESKPAQIQKPAADPTHKKTGTTESTTEDKSMIMGIPREVVERKASEITEEMFSTWIKDAEPSIKRFYGSWEHVKSNPMKLNIIASLMIQVAEE